MAGAKFLKNNKVVNGMGALDINGQTLTEDRISMKLYRHLTVILNFGVIGAAVTVTLKQATDVTNSASDEKAVTFTEYFARVGVTADTFTRTSCSSTFNTGTTTNSLYVIELDAIQLDQNSNFDCVRVDLTDPSNATLVSITYILSDPRYAQEVMPAVITN